MASTNPLTVTASGDLDIVIEREFNAPRDLVWRAFTEPELVQRWLGVFGDWGWGGCEMDVRSGGRYRWQWNGPEGAQMVLSGTYQEVDPPSRLVSTQAYEGMDEFGEMLVTLVLTERDGVTYWHETVRYPTRETRDTDIERMPYGLEPGFANLDELLGTLVEA
jgi:uncharacterized protein YndB with AHSA1/START domain